MANPNSSWKDWSLHIMLGIIGFCITGYYLGLEKKLDNITIISTQVAVIQTQVSYLNDKVEKLENRVDYLQAKDEYENKFPNNKENTNTSINRGEPWINYRYIAYLDSLFDSNPNI